VSEIKLPEGCNCDPSTHGADPEPVCVNYYGMTDGSLDWCGNCGHDWTCHSEFNDPVPRPERMEASR
jgi:hypothetical protein